MRIKTKQHTIKSIGMSYNGYFTMTALAFDKSKQTDDFITKNKTLFSHLLKIRCCVFEKAYNVAMN